MFDWLLGAAGDDDVIEFLCESEMYGAIPEPVPASRVLEGWYDELGTHFEAEGATPFQTRTVRNCMPFLEALNLGWVIPTPADVHFEAEGGQLDWNAQTDWKPISGHHIQQVGPDFFNVYWPIGKWLNRWRIVVPDGYSILVVPPLNREHRPFEIFSGVVTADKYDSMVNFPFMWTGGEFDDIVNAGTPMAQVIPFKREAMLTDGLTRPMTDEEKQETLRTTEGNQSNRHFYRDDVWEPIESTRMVPHDGE